MNIPLLLSRQKTADGQRNLEEDCFYTRRHLRVLNPSSMATMYPTNGEFVPQAMTQCYGMIADHRCDRQTNIFPYCVYHTVQYLKVIPDLQFGGMGLFAYDPTKSANDMEGNIVFHNNTVIVPYEAITASFPSTEPLAPSQKIGETHYVVNIAEPVTQNDLEERYGTDMHSPYGVNTAIRDEYTKNTKFFDALLVRSIGSLANTAKQISCNARLEVNQEDNVVIVATRDIINTEPILLWYGDDFYKHLQHQELPIIEYDPPMDARVDVALSLFS